MYVKEQFRKVKAIYPEAVASTTAGTPTSIDITGYDIIIYCIGVIKHEHN